MRNFRRAANVIRSDPYHLSPHHRATPEEGGTGWASDTAGCWVSGVGCNPRMTFDGKVRNLGLRTMFSVTLNSIPRPPYKFGGGSASISGTYYFVIGTAVINTHTP